MEEDLQHPETQLYWKKWVFAKALKLRRSPEDRHDCVCEVVVVGRAQDTCGGTLNDSDSNQEARGCWELGEAGWPEGGAWWTPLLASGTSRKQMSVALCTCRLGKVIVPRPDPGQRDTGVNCDGLCDVIVISITPILRDWFRVSLRLACATERLRQKD